MPLHLIIKHGDRSTRHPVMDTPITIGRDPGCSLFFSDKKLSRRHARIDPDPAGVKVTDLGSRNGTWVNERRVDERFIRPGDSIRLGGLEIELSTSNLLVEEADDSAKPSSQTQVLSPSESPDARPPDSVMFRAGSGPPASVRSSEPSMSSDGSEPPTEPDGSGTVVLPAGTPEPPPPTVTLRREPREESGTIAFRSSNNVGDSNAAESPSSNPSSTPGTQSPNETVKGIFAPAWASSRPTVRGEVAQVPSELQVPSTRERRPWSVKFAAVLFGVGLITYILLAAVFTSSSSRALHEESILRGRALLRAMVATAEHVGVEKLSGLSFESFLTEKGVREALVVSAEGKILAPAERAGESLSRIEGIQAPIEEIRTLQLGVRASGEYVMVHPLFHDTVRTGVAVLTFGAAESNRVSMVVVGLLILAAGLIAIYAVSRNMTLTPLTRLCRSLDDLGSLEGGAREPGYSEIDELRDRVTHLIRAAWTPTQTLPPASDPSATLIPGASDPRPGGEIGKL